MLIIESFHLQIRGQYSRPPLQLQRKIAMYLSRKFQILTDDHIISYHIYHFISYQIILYHIIPYHIKLHSNVIHQHKQALKTKLDVEDMIKRPRRPDAIIPLTKVLSKMYKGLQNITPSTNRQKKYKTCPK